ncbi:MAG: radical SAM protein [Candidatus Bathyarchaeia archaeon]
MFRVMLYDPLRLAAEVEGIVAKGRLRRYYRVARPGRWYGGIATADCCGCCLRCVFCWSGAPRDNPGGIGRFYSPEEVHRGLIGCAEKHGYGQLRVSGNEPTIGREHLFRMLDLIDQTRYRFILETNGILIDPSYARQLSKYNCVHVRVSLKGASPEEFSTLTKAKPEGFSLQLNALRNLLDAGVPCHPAAMLSFSTKKRLKALKAELHGIDPSLARELEEEYVFLYPHVAERLSREGIKPLIAYTPGGIPRELI